MGSIHNTDGGEEWGKNIMHKGGMRQKSLKTTDLDLYEYGD